MCSTRTSSGTSATTRSVAATRPVSGAGCRCQLRSCSCQPSRRCSVASPTTPTAPPPDDPPEAPEDAPDLEAGRAAAEGDAQLALDAEPSDDAVRAQAPPVALEDHVDAAAVVRLRERHPERRDWPLDELVKLAPSIIRNEQLGEQEQQDPSLPTSTTPAARAQPAGGRRGARRLTRLPPAAPAPRDPLRPPRPSEAVPAQRSPSASDGSMHQAPAKIANRNPGSTVSTSGTRGAPRSSGMATTSSGSKPPTSEATRADCGGVHDHERALNPSKGPRRAP